ncbi:Polycystic kidney disease 2-like 1 protein [Liparis tanakae]|uniref:Polycystic kidney disease 2-like 1 protein n=1 Tax=Liparis tanakae TaxID=230148 RepID=A0A4Z2F1H9_9TELE|nr:Polycystic kidney disease 2-like 1 protein [Liparis tanakae]
MKCLNNRADSHLTGQVELDSVANGAWVNQGYCGSPPPAPRAVSTVHGAPPPFQGSMERVYKLDRGAGLPEEAPPSGRGGKRRGCCSFIKGFWGTTLTENTSDNRELFVRTTLRELLVYLVFLVDICLCKYYPT